MSERPTKCTICSGKLLAGGLCKRHYHRKRENRPMSQPWDFDNSPRYAIHRRPNVTYSTAHMRPKQLWGSASAYPCVKCGAKSRDWAYDGTDPSELYGKHEWTDGTVHYLRYSAWPEFYKPMCSDCHLKEDGARRKSELREYREWKHRTGLTLAEVSERLGLPV